MITLTDRQEEAVEGATQVASARGSAVYRIGGYAGTGKSTILRNILGKSQGMGLEAIPCAYTGKAASVMRTKGIAGASTIHSAIYTWDGEKEAFRKKEWDEVEGDYFLLDEASMVGSAIYRDIQSYNKPIVAVGDMRQLPPISKGDINLMEDPDVCLDQIHRQREGSDIIDLATFIRTCDDINGYWPTYSSDEAKVLPKGSTVQGTPDIFICGYNKTRVGLNNQCRRILGRREELCIGERIVCLRNDVALGVSNGMTGTVVALDEGDEACDNSTGELCWVYSTLVLWDGETEARVLKVSNISLGQDKAPAWGTWRNAARSFAICDYAYAVTCHKAQGSQFDNVAVFNEAAPKLWDQKRWLYTAVTRAARSVCVFR